MTEFRSTTDPKEGRISGNTFEHRLVRYSALGGMAIFEGDIALGPVTKIEAVSARAEIQLIAPQGIAVSGSAFRWPNRLIPFRIDPALPQPERVTEAIKQWQARTAIRFLELDNSTLNQYPARVYFTSQDGCWSEIGCRGGEQLVSLGDGCTVGNAIHEIGHTVGLWHEQSRKDRDIFVTIAWANIIDGMRHNFDQHIDDGDDIGAYDYGSIMHYPSNAFSKNGQATIVAKSSEPIGQRQALSKGDIAAVQSMY